MHSASAPQSDNPGHGRRQKSARAVHVVVYASQHLVLVADLVAYVNGQGLESADFLLQLVSHSLVLLLEGIVTCTGPAWMLRQRLIIVVRASHASSGVRIRQDENVWFPEAKIGERT